MDGGLGLGRLVDWGLGIALRAMAGVVKFTEGAFRRAEGRLVPSTIYYSTKVRVCDKVAENLIFVGRDSGLEIRDLGGWNGLLWLHFGQKWARLVVRSGSAS
jgi:hypothetical protein